MRHGTWSVRSWNASSLNYHRDAFIWIDEGGDHVQVAARLLCAAFTPDGMPDRAARLSAGRHECVFHTNLKSDGNDTIDPYRRAASYVALMELKEIRPPLVTKKRKV
jgi:hypothetical protein